VDKADSSICRPDDVRWTVIGNTAVSRAYNSKKEFIEGAVKPLGEKIGGAIQPKLRDIIADGDKVVLQWTALRPVRTARHIIRLIVG
jgi:hypothetical protein